MLAREMYTELLSVDSQAVCMHIVKLMEMYLDCWVWVADMKLRRL